MEKTNYMNTLYEFYHVLLTDKQSGYLSLYYGDDYSLGEIADEFEVSRQAVYDNIKRTEKILREYEKKLHLARDYHSRTKALENLEQYAANRYPDDEKLRTLIEEIEASEE